MTKGDGPKEKLATAVYADAVAPAAREVGTTLGKLVHLGLLPANFALDTFIDAAEGALEGARARLKRRFVPKERITTPPPEVSIPVIQSLRIRGGDEGIRDMYLNLLAGAMDSATQELAHPAFAEIIRQLTPMEARVIPLFYPPFQSAAMYALVRLLGRKSAPSKFGGYEEWTLSHYFSDLTTRVSFEEKDGGPARLGECDVLPPGSIDNFVRLGLAYIPENFVIVNETLYQRIEKFPDFAALRERLAKGAPELSIVPQHRTLIVTELGRQFAHVCSGMEHHKWVSEESAGHSSNAPL